MGAMRSITILLLIVAIAACGSAEDGETGSAYAWAGGRCIELRSPVDSSVVRWAEFDNAVQGDWNEPPATFGLCPADLVSGTINLPTDIPDGDYLICTTPETDCRTVTVDN